MGLLAINKKKPIRMAKKTTMGEQKRVAKPKVRRPGVHAKTKRDHSKQGKQWLKLSRGQG